MDRYKIEVIMEPMISEKKGRPYEWTILDYDFNKKEWSPMLRDYSITAQRAWEDAKNMLEGLRRDYLNSSEFEKSINQAADDKIEYIGLKLDFSDLPDPEIIIDKVKNFENKLEYYRNQYDGHLAFKNLNSIRIIDYAFANTVEELFEKLNFKKEKEENE